MRRTAMLATVLVAAASVAAAAPATASGAATATVSVLHAVPGLTVDVYANGDELVPDFAPGTLTDPLELPAGTYDLAVFAAAIAAACIGFLWWNAKPARIIMGDVGALAIGGALAGLAIMSRTELLMAVIAGTEEEARTLSDLLVAMRGGRELRIEAGRANLTLPLTGAGAALAALRTCAQRAGMMPGAAPTPAR